MLVREQERVLLLVCFSAMGFVVVRYLVQRGSVLYMENHHPRKIHTPFPLCIFVLQT